MKKIQNNARLNCFIAFIDTRLKGIGVAEDNGKSVIKNWWFNITNWLIGEDIIKYTSSICTLDKVLLYKNQYLLKYLICIIKTIMNF